MNVQTKRISPLWFFIPAALVYGVALLLLPRLESISQAELLATGLTLDLIALVPVLYWLVMISRGRMPAITLLPVFLLSFLAANLLLPDRHHDLLNLVGIVVPVIEIGILGYVGYRMFRILRAGRLASLTGEDFYDALRRQLTEVIDRPAVVDIFAYEFSTFYYALARPARIRTAQGLTYHRRSSAGAIFFGLLMAVVAESIALHFLLMMWSPTAALVHFGLSLYALLFLLGDYRAIRRRPHLIEGERLQVRCGIRWQATIDIRDIVSVVRTRIPPTDEGYVSLAPFGTPSHVITLRRSIPVVGPYGMKKEGKQIGIVVDQQEEFEETMRVAEIPLG